MILKNIRKATIIFALAILGIGSFTVITNQDANYLQTMSTNVEIDVYEEALSILLLKRLQQASDSYYDGSYAILPTVELDTTELEQIYEQNGIIILEFKIMPFIGPHNTVGIDHLTLSLDNRGNVMFLNYQHSEDF